MKIEWEVRRDIVRYGKMLYERKLTVGTSGNISARVSDDAMVITPSGACKGMMREYDLVRMDILAGRVTSGGKPSMETPFHLEMYRGRKDVGAVVHCHPLFSTILACAGEKPRSDLTPEGLMVLGAEVPLVPYATPGTEELARRLRETAIKGNAFLLENHGAIAVGRDLGEAFYRMETLEFLAELQVRSAGPRDLRSLPKEEADRIPAIMAKEK